MLLLRTEDQVEGNYPAEVDQDTILPVYEGHLAELKRGPPFDDDRSAEVENDHEETDDQGYRLKKRVKAIHFDLECDVHRRHEGNVDQVDELEQL